jgi:hypothetical protein
VKWIKNSLKKMIMTRLPTDPMRCAWARDLPLAQGARNQGEYRYRGTSSFALMFGRNPTHDVFEKLAELNVDLDEVATAEDPVVRLATIVGALPTEVFAEADKDLLQKLATKDAFEDEEVRCYAKAFCDVNIHFFKITVTLSCHFSPHLPRLRLLLMSSRFLSLSTRA